MMLRADREKQIHESLFTAVQKLRGRIDISSFKNYLLTIIFLRQASLFASRRKFYQNFDDLDVRVHAFNTVSFNTLFEQRNVPGNARRIDGALHLLETSNGSDFYGLFESTRFSKSKFGDDAQSDAIWKEILEALGPTTDHQSGEALAHEIKNTAWIYDSVVEYFAELEGKVGEDFATPKAVGELLARLVKPCLNETVYDPASGTGSLLVAMAQATSNHFGMSPAAIFGQEINATNCSLARMNLFIHGEYRNIIAHGDTLLSPAFKDGEHLKRFDVVVSHPPFQSRWDSKRASRGFFSSRFRYGIPPDSKADYAFILHMLASLSQQKGRMCVVVSHGVLFRSGVEGAIRESLIKENLLDAVIGLPPKLFYNTSIPVAALLFKKNRPADQRDVLFVNAADEFEAGRNQNRLRAVHIDKIARVYEAYESEEKISRLVSFDEIAANDFSLSIQRYLQEPDNIEPSIDLDAIRAERQRVMLSIQRMEEEINQLMENLGQDNRHYLSKRKHITS